MSCSGTHHLNYVPRLRREKHDISLKIVHQAGFETARQAATLAERHALIIAPCPSLTPQVHTQFPAPTTVYRRDEGGGQAF